PPPNTSGNSAAANLTDDSFTLTDATGQSKTTFTAGEPIYVKAQITASGPSYIQASLKTQFYTNRPSTPAINSNDSPDIHLTVNNFNPSAQANPAIYESRPNGLGSYLFATRFFSKGYPGTYTARVFADSTNALAETNETDNHRAI